MRRPALRVAFVLLVMTAFWLWRRSGGDRFDEIDYAGQKFTLSKAYSDYDDYKDDENNLAPGQEAQIEQAMLGVKLEPTLPNRDEVIRKSHDLRFPGYGMTSFGERAQVDGTLLAGHSVEIPMSSKERVFVYQTSGGPYTLVDDFVADANQMIMNVTLKNGQLEYTDLQGRVITTRPVPTGK